MHSYISLSGEGPQTPHSEFLPSSPLPHKVQEPSQEREREDWKSQNSTLQDHCAQELEVAVALGLHVIKPANILARRGRGS